MCTFISIVYLRCVGGEVGATSSLAPKIGPLGLVSLYFINIYYLKMIHIFFNIHIYIYIHIFFNI